VVVRLTLSPTFCGLETPARDARVKERVAAEMGLYDLDPVALAEIAPDVVLTQDLCRVCALPAEEAAAALDAAGCPGDVVTLDPHGSTRCSTACWPSRRRQGDRRRGTGCALPCRSGSTRWRPPSPGARGPGCWSWSGPTRRTGRHWVPDLVTRPGPRVVDGVEAMAWALHPDAVPAPPPGRVAQVAPAGAASVRS
jgi:iron complex transport system substrate-binding protein